MGRNGVTTALRLSGISSSEDLPITMTKPVDSSPPPPLKLAGKPITHAALTLTNYTLFITLSRAPISLGQLGHSKQQNTILVVVLFWAMAS